MRRYIVTVALQPDGQVFAFPYSTTANGLDIIDGLPEVADSIEDAIAVGNIAITALNRSKERPLPAVNMKETDVTAGFLAWVGKRTWVDYMKGVKSLSLYARAENEVGDVWVTPDQNKGRRGATPLVDLEVTTQIESPEQFGTVIQEAMAKAIA